MRVHKEVAHGLFANNLIWEQQLEFHPFDDDRKRVRVQQEGLADLAYRTWRVHFFERSPRVLEITHFSSGYSDQDLSAAEDVYKDKALHREFRAAVFKSP